MPNKELELGHEQIRRYLISSGWEKQQDQLPGVSERFLKDSKILDLVVESALPSYPAYLKDTVRALSIFEQEDYGSLIGKIERVGSHQLSVTIDDGKPGHRIRLPDSKRLRESIYNMVLAASHSALGPSINHPRLSKRDALEFQSECYEDQTARSSYVANFLIPDLKTESLSGKEVFKTIGTALAVSKQIASREVLPSSAEYENLAKQGISANLLQAVSDLKEIGASDHLKFQLNNEEPLLLSNEQLSNLHDFYSEIVLPTTHVEEVTAKVIASSAAPECTITLERDIGKERQVIKVVVSTDQYKQVINEEHRLISVTGGVTVRPVVKIIGIFRSRSRGRKEMVDVTDFEVIRTIS